MNRLWDIKPQAITSANTALHQVPALHKKVDFVPGTVNADIGGGPYEDATDFLRERDVTNVVWDPFNRSHKHNQKAARAIRDGQAATATVANVLNTIRSKADRAMTIRRAANAVGADGTAYFQVHEGDRSGVGRVTTKGWQGNRKLASYVPEISKYFKVVECRNRVITARQFNL